MSLNVRGMTALHVASTKCASSIIRELLANASLYGIDVNSTDSEGNTALHHAAASSSGSGTTGGMDPNQCLSIVKLLVEEYNANVLWKNYNALTPYDMARSQTVRGYLLPKQLQAEAALGIMDDNATTTATTTTSSLVNNNAGPPPTSIPISNISNHIGGEKEEDVYDPVAALMRPTVGALGNVRNYTSVPSLSTSAATTTTATTTSMPTMMSHTMSSPMMQTPSFHQQYQEQDQEQLLQPTSNNNDNATESVVPPSSSSPSSSSVLPEGWIECIDQMTNAIYYYNSITGVSSWDHPSSSSSSLIQGEGGGGGGDDVNHYTETIETNLQKDALQDGWIECVDPTNSNIVYYYNETTGVSQWDRPMTMEDDTPSKNEGGNNVNWDTLQKDIAAVTVTDDNTNNDIDNIVVEDIVLTNANDVHVAKTVAEESIQSFSHTTNECFEQPVISVATTTALMSSFGEDDDDDGGDDNVLSTPPLDTTNDPSLATESLYHQPQPTEEEMPPPHEEVVHNSSSTTPSIITDKQKQNMPVKTTLFAITPPFVSVTTPKQPQQQEQEPLRPLLNAPSSGNTTGTRGRVGGGGLTATSTATSTITASTRLQQSSAPTSGTKGGGGYALRGGHANAAAAILSSSSTHHYSTTAPMSGGSVGSGSTRPRVIYKPDGFHSSSNDRELQLKYGHVTNEHDQQRLALIGPPPTSLGVVGGVGSSSTQQGVGGGTSMPPVGGVGYANNNPYFASSSSSSRYPSSAAPSSFGGYDPNNRGGATSSVVPAYATFQSPPPKDD
jgi:hypothetical protein